MKNFLILGFLVALYIDIATPSALYAADAIFCRQEEIVATQIPQALEKDAFADSKGEESGGDGAYFDLTDTLIAEGSCAQIPTTDISFTSGEKVWCSTSAPDACFVFGAVMAKLPEEVGNHFARGYALLTKEDAPDSVLVGAGKGDLEVAHTPPVLAKTTP